MYHGVIMILKSVKYFQSFMQKKEKNSHAIKSLNSTTKALFASKKRTKP